MTEADFRPGIYEHYKSTPKGRRYYMVLGKGRHTETEEIVAVYVPMYFLAEHKGSRIQVRPFAMFLQDVEWQGKTMPRFRYIGQEL